MEGDPVIPKIFSAIAAAVDTGAPIDKLEKLYGFNRDVLKKVHSYVKTGEGGDDATIQKLVARYTPKPEARSYKYMVDGREQWADQLNYPVATDGNRPMKEVVKQVAQKYGIRPEILYASAMEEGLNKAVKGKAFNPGGTVSGILHLGLDDLQEYPLKDVKYHPVKSVNEKGRVINSGDFKSISDGLAAKAQVFNAFREKVKKKAEESGFKIADEDALDFLTMQAYNMGPEKLPKYFKKYQEEGLLEGNAFLDKDPSGTYEENESYVHSRRRMDPARAMRDKKIFD